jgi:2-methylisocitrate lyase-like PEP mutase family enzyme
MSHPTNRAAEFRRLHDAGCFVIPNPWDAGSAQLLARMGFSALATTSAGCAWSLGRQDNHVSLEQALTHFAAIAAAVAVPLNGDFEGAFAIEPADVAVTIARAATTGVAGLSIEDSTGDGSKPLFEFALAVERVRAARQAIDDSATQIVLTGRSEGFLVGRPDLDATIKRLVAYAEAGADCLYAPGLRSKEDIVAVVRAVAPKPVNVLVGGGSANVSELADLGVRRISVGGALARVAWSAFLEAATEIRQQGSFAALGRARPFAEINALFHR